MTRLAIACAFFFLSFHATAQNYFSCDFENGIPADFTLIDYDGNTPSTSMKKVGFDVEIPWIATTLASDKENTIACSTSWYTPAGTSDDWLITPEITLSGSNPELSFRAMASDKKHSDGFVVYVSEGGEPQKTSFDVESPLLLVANEASEWTEHIVSLAKYAGKTIRLAFVNNSTDCSRLYLDDIDISESHKARIAITTPKFVNYVGDVAVSATVSTRLSEPIKGFTVQLDANGESFTQHFDEEVTSSTPVSFTLDRKIHVEKLQKVPYKVAVTVDDDTDSQSSTLSSYPRKVVCEEGTATWCSWCVRGLVILDSIKNNYSDRIIGIAAHSGDVMSSNYYSYVSQYFGSGLPTGSVNRMVKSDPLGFIRYSQLMLNNNETFCTLNLSVLLDKTSRTVTAKTVTTFAEAQADHKYALAYAILENDIHQPDDENYRQHNAYANGSHGVMGGYEKYDEYIPQEKMWFQDVARGYVDDLSGIDGSLPETIQAETPVVDERTFVLPDNILVDNNVEIVAMLIDKTDGHIVNAESASVSGQETGIQNEAIAANYGKPAAIYTVGGELTKSFTKGINLVRLDSGKVIKIFVK